MNFSLKFGQILFLFHYEKKQQSPFLRWVIRLTFSGEVTSDSGKSEREREDFCCSCFPVFSLYAKLNYARLIQAKLSGASDSVSILQTRFDPALSSSSKCATPVTCSWHPAGSAKEFTIYRTCRFKEHIQNKWCYLELH